MLVLYGSLVVHANNFTRTNLITRTPTLCRSLSGINRSGKKWMAQAYRHGRTRYLGTYDTKDAAMAAIAAFDAGKEIVLHGRTYQSSSGIKGISKNGNKWSARSYRNGVLQYLGAYSTKEAAAQAIADFERMVMSPDGSQESGLPVASTGMGTGTGMGMGMGVGVGMGMGMGMGWAWVCRQLLENVKEYPRMS